MIFEGFVLIIKPSLSKDPWETHFDLYLTYFYHALHKQIQFVVILKVTIWEEGKEFWQKPYTNLKRGEGTAKKSLSLTQNFSMCISLLFYFCLNIWQAMLPDPWSYKSPIVPIWLFSTCVSLCRGELNVHIG